MAIVFMTLYDNGETGSTSAALISVIHAIISLLTDNSFIVIARDFSKAFDTNFSSLLSSRKARSHHSYPA